MTESQAAWTSVREYKLRSKGYHDKERAQWERSRWMMFLALQMQPFIKKHSKPSTPQSWIRFPWETERWKEIRPEECVVTAEQAEKLTILAKRLKERRNEQAG